MKYFNVTYFLVDEEYTDLMSEGQFNNFCKRVDDGTAEEQLLEVDEVKEDLKNA